MMQAAVTQISKRTLSDAVAAKRSGLPIESISDPAACTLCFIRICDALHAVHLRGVVHDALSPEVIFLSDDGQVNIDGWKEHADGQPLTARLCASAPAIAPAMPADGLYGDIRELAACFFIALVGEAPPRDGTGALGEVDLASSSRIPKALLWVIRKAMSSTAAEGYASVAELRADLLRFLSGHLARREKPGIVDVALRSVAARGRIFAVIALLVAGLAGAAVVYNWWNVRTYATWGSPLVDEDFSGAAWKSDWSLRGRWEYQDGRMVSRSERDCALIYKRRLIPPVAIEYTGRFASTVRPGDLSVWWCEDDSPNMSPGDNVDKTNSWFVQAGAYDNSWCTIWQTPALIRSQVNSLVLQPDRDYHFRVEIESNRLRMWIDHQQVLEHLELFPIASGNIGLYTWDPGKTFTNVRIWQKEIPTLVSPLEVGDDSYRSGRFQDASAAYARVAASHRGTSLGQEALFFNGLALHKQGMRRLASQTWRQLTDGPLRHRADTLDLDNLITDRDVPGAVERFIAMWNAYPDVRAIMRQRWQICGQRLCQPPVNTVDLEAWISLRDACFPKDPASRWLVADMLNRLGRWEEILSRFPDERRSAAQAMLALGRNAELLASPWATSSERVSALAGMGDLEGLLRLPDLERGTRATLLCKAGRAEEAILLDPYPAVIYLDRIDELLAKVPEGTTVATCLQIAAGRWADAAAAKLDGKPSGNSGWALQLLGRLEEAEALGKDVRLPRMLRFLAAGDIEKARELRSGVTGNLNAARFDSWFAHGPGLAMVDEMLGDASALRRALQRCAGTTGSWGNRMALVCAAALDPSKDEAVSAMPWRTEADAWLIIARALRAELAKDRTAALAEWRAYAALPPIKRLLAREFPCVEVEAFATWRIGMLGRISQ